MMLLLERLISTTTGRLRISARRPSMSCSNASATDAPRMGDLDRLADMEGEVRGRNIAEPELARVQRDRDVARQECDDLHVSCVVAPRDQVVLGLHQVERDHL